MTGARSMLAPRCFFAAVLPVIARGDCVLGSHVRIRPVRFRVFDPPRHIPFTVVVAIGALGLLPLIGTGGAFGLLALVMGASCAVLAWRRSRTMSWPARRGWTVVAIGGASTSAAQAWWVAARPVAGSREQVVLLSAVLGSAIMFAVGAALLRPPGFRRGHSSSPLLDLACLPAAVTVAFWAVLVDHPRHGSVLAGAPVAITWALVAALAAATTVMLHTALRPSWSDARGVSPIITGIGCVFGAQIALIVALFRAVEPWVEPSVALVGGTMTVFAAMLERERRRPAMASVISSGDVVQHGSAWTLFVGDLVLAVACAALIWRAVEVSPESGSLLPLAVALFVGMVSARHGYALQSAIRHAAALLERAERDPLTGLLNHRALHDRLDQCLAAAGGTRWPVVAALVDIDHCRQINDQYGQVVGDHVLHAVAGAVRRACRRTDVAARFAGDKFALVLPGVEPGIAPAIGERVLSEVMKLGYWAGRDAERPVSVSVGLAVARSGCRSGRHLLAAADGALQEAKRDGRSRFVVVNADLRDHELEPDVDARRLLTAQPAV